MPFHFRFASSISSILLAISASRRSHNLLTCRLMGGQINRGAPDSHSQTVSVLNSISPPSGVLFSHFPRLCRSPQSYWVKCVRMCGFVASEKSPFYRRERERAGSREMRKRGRRSLPAPELGRGAEAGRAAAASNGRHRAVFSLLPFHRRSRGAGDETRQPPRHESRLIQK